MENFITEVVSIGSDILKDITLVLFKVTGDVPEKKSSLVMLLRGAYLLITTLDQQ